MKTDHYFYKIFRREPHLLFDLVGLERRDDYHFESITVKETEKRTDGFFMPARGQGPNVFAEFQGYKDRAIYWRVFRELAMWHESNPEEQRPFLVVVLFVAPSLDPGEPPVLFKPPCRMIRANLVDCLERLRGSSGLWVVLEPLVLEDVAELGARAREWKEALRGLKFEANDRTFWEEQLEYAILQRFPTLTLEEVKRMIELTPLEETTAVRQLVAMGREEGREEGLQRGQLIGQIAAYQKFLHREKTPKGALEGMTLEELVALVSELERVLQ